MDTFYTNERNAQILIALMKAHGIKKIIASPASCTAAAVEYRFLFPRRFAKNGTVRLAAIGIIVMIVATSEESVVFPI